MKVSSDKKPSTPVGAEGTSTTSLVCCRILTILDDTRSVGDVVDRLVDFTLGAESVRDIGDSCTTDAAELPTTISAPHMKGSFDCTGLVTKKIVQAMNCVVKIDGGDSCAHWWCFLAPVGALGVCAHCTR